MKNLHTILFFCMMLLSAALVTSCSSDEEEIPEPEPTPTAMEPMLTATIWDGPNITFTKEDGTDETLEGNQDRITDNVWITRGTAGGEIFNIRTESASTQGVSPDGTMWAIGTTSDLAGLEFDTFRNAVGSPQDVVGVDLVLLLVEDDILIDLTFTSWSAGRDNMGGFEYIRSTQP